MYINTVTQEGSVTFLILQSRTVNDAWFNLQTLFSVSCYISEYVGMTYSFNICQKIQH